MKLENINKPTPAKWVKIGTAVLAVATFMGSYGTISQKSVVQVIGLCLGAIGTLIIALN